VSQMLARMLFNPVKGKRFRISKIYIIKCEHHGYGCAAFLCSISENCIANILLSLESIPICNYKLILVTFLKIFFYLFAIW
jgi:hypothetical protein